MTWIKYKNKAPSPGKYQVVKMHLGIKDMAFFKGTPPHKTIEFMIYKQTMKLEQSLADRVVYVKYYAFF